MRQPDPDFVIAWRNRMNEPPPRCCNTCDYYAQDGSCRTFNMIVPSEFTREKNVCKAWFEEIPF